MPAFEVVPHPVFSPTRCVTCGSSACPDGFVDLLADSASLGFDDHGAPIHDPAGLTGTIDPATLIPTIGHLYMCVTCMSQGAVRIGGCDRADRKQLEQNIADLEAANQELLEQLEAERLNKVVSLADVEKLVGARAPVRGAA